MISKLMSINLFFMALFLTSDSFSFRRQQFQNVGPWPWETSRNDQRRRVRNRAALGSFFGRTVVHNGGIHHGLRCCIPAISSSTVSWKPNFVDRDGLFLTNVVANDLRRSLKGLVEIMHIQVSAAVNHKPQALRKVKMWVWSFEAA
jgi:hypothetical protein